jgi:hypothetical protein
MELEELLKSELNQDSPDFTAEEAESAIDTSSEEDFAIKLTEHLKELIENGGSGRTDYRRKKFGGVNYMVLCFSDSKIVFKMAWLS